MHHGKRWTKLKNIAMTVGYRTGKNVEIRFMLQRPGNLLG